MTNLPKQMPWPPAPNPDVEKELARQLTIELGEEVERLRQENAALRGDHDGSRGVTSHEAIQSLVAWNHHQSEENARLREVLDRMTAPAEFDGFPPFVTDDNGTWCAWCEAGKTPRKPAKHADACAWLAARKALQPPESEVLLHD